jgi:hypothetical protein
MSDKNLQRCKAILVGEGRGEKGVNGIQDDQMSCNTIESILPILLNQTFGVNSHMELARMIHPCLRNILQFWTKGQSAVTNKWSPSCLGLATALGKHLSIEKCSVDDFSKYYKLIGFVLAKVTAMGTVSHPLRHALTMDRGIR